MSNKTKLQVKKIHLKRKVNGVMTNGYCGRLVSRGVKDFNTLLEDASTRVTIHKEEVALGTALLLESALRALEEGFIVDLGPLGKLSTSVHCKWSTNEDDLNPNDMTVGVVYKPSAKVKESMKALKVKWYNPKNK